MKHLGKLAAGISLALLVTGAVAAKPSALEVSLAPSAEKSDAGSGRLRYTLSNFGTTDLLVLAWETPLRGVEDDLFEVTIDGNPVEYVGRHFKRGLPQAEDYIEVKAGESLSVDIDLSAHYEMHAKGHYAAQAVAHFHDNFALRSKAGADTDVVPLSDMDLRSETVHLWVDGSDQPLVQDSYGVFSIAKAGSVSFVGCSNSQQSSIGSGVNAAKSMSADANSYLGANKTGSRYTTWFGSYSSANYNTLKSNFAAIGDALNNKPLVFDCGTCTQNAYAYVYPSQAYKVYLCGAYWSAPTSGTDSKGGTTIHEVSHFNVVAGTDDVAYGQTACKKLAKRPKSAIRNADSHEYFAENTPSLN
jgi:peptidyl-Lys metalloendopeptidase